MPVATTNAITFIHITNVFKTDTRMLDKIHFPFQSYGKGLNYTTSYTARLTYYHFWIEWYLSKWKLSRTTLQWHFVSCCWFRNHSFADSMDRMIKGAVYQRANNVDSGTKYRETSNKSRSFIGNKIVDYSDVVGASLVGTAQTTYSFSTKYLASMGWAKTTARHDDKHSSLEIWGTLYRRLDGVFVHHIHVMHRKHRAVAISFPLYHLHLTWHLLCTFKAIKESLKTHPPHNPTPHPNPTPV